MAVNGTTYTRLRPPSTSLLLRPFPSSVKSSTHLRNRYISFQSSRSPKKDQNQKAEKPTERPQEVQNLRGRLKKWNPLRSPDDGHAKKYTPEKNPIMQRYNKKQTKSKQHPKTRQEQDLEERFGEPSNPRLNSSSGTLQPDSIINQVAPPSALKGYNSERRAQFLDPRPHARRRWQRKMVIREVRRAGWMSKAEILKRTERALTVRSEFFKTSMKKLNPLANQLKGKSIEDAITQMDFSKKKPAMAVKAHLEEARDRAVARRGMGLGKVEGTKGEPARIRLRDGKKHLVEDRTGIYIDQAWTGKGKYGQAVNPRAKGRMDLLRLPQTSISVLLKEEKTRIREHEERYQKWRNRKMWNPLPDRPLVGQRQYYSW
ncbi:MAG: 54S ribosomal protein L22, mitochondrial [Alyxoria varia]|nr:MAG: 54S ribosomal protein L22, mitochondrial [Alyxoria varia]